MAAPSGCNFYLPIAEAKKTPNRRVNLFAKICEVGFPRKSRGTGDNKGSLPLAWQNQTDRAQQLREYLPTRLDLGPTRFLTSTDYIVVLKLVDQSCPSPGLSVTFFADDTKKLPHVRSAGDMISLHHVEMKIRNGEVYCLFGKKVSSFALFNGKTDMTVNPYQISPKFSSANHDNKLLLQFRALSLEHQSDEGLVKRLSLLRNIEMGKTFDIICKVLHVSKVFKDEWILYVWDGTDCPPIIFEHSLEVEKEKPIPLYLEPLPLPKELLCSFPCEGTVLRIFSDKFFEDIHHYHAGDCWVKLYNVTCELQSGLWKGVVSSSSKLFMLSDEVDKVKYRNRIHNERCASALERMPLASFPEPSYIVETEHMDAAYATLMDSITHHQVAHRLKCVVRAIASCPWKGEDLRSPVSGSYRIRLTLEDPTARVHAYIFGEDGVKFFGSNPTANELTQMMRKLLGMREPGSEETICTSRDPPWIWCCLMSHYLDESDPWGSRRYRIFDTRLVG